MQNYTYRANTAPTPTSAEERNELHKTPQEVVQFFLCTSEELASFRVGRKVCNVLLLPTALAPSEKHMQEKPDQGSFFFLQTISKIISTRAKENIYLIIIEKNPQY